MESDQAYSSPLEADRVAQLVAARRALRGPPTRTGLERLLVLRLRCVADGGGARVKAEAGDHRGGGTRVREERDPLPEPPPAPAHEAAAGHPAPRQAGGAQ